MTLCISDHVCQLLGMLSDTIHLRPETLLDFPIYIIVLHKEIVDSVFQDGWQNFVPTWLEGDGPEVCWVSGVAFLVDEYCCPLLPTSWYLSTLPAFQDNSVEDRSENGAALEDDDWELVEYGSGCRCFLLS